MTPTSTPTLTPTERRIVELVCRGLTNPQIAAELFIEHSTVRWHLKNVFRKLDVRTRTELMAKWLGTPIAEGKQDKSERNGPDSPQM